MTDKELKIIQDYIESVVTKTIEKSVESAIQKKVNGKIDTMNTRLDKHLNEIEPFMQGVRGVRVLRNSALWVAVTITAIGAAILMVKNIFK